MLLCHTSPLRVSEVKNPRQRYAFPASLCRGTLGQTTPRIHLVPTLCVGMPSWTLPRPAALRRTRKAWRTARAIRVTHILARGKVGGPIDSIDSPELHCDSSYLTTGKDLLVVGADLREAPDPWPGTLGRRLSLRRQPPGSSISLTGGRLYRFGRSPRPSQPPGSSSSLTGGVRREGLDFTGTLVSPEPCTPHLELFLIFPRGGVLQCHPPPL